MSWDFSRLPKEEHRRVIELLRAGNYAQLIRLHNQYRLSINIYCCRGAERIVGQWFAWAINKGIISDENDGSEEG